MHHKLRQPNLSPIATPHNCDVAFVCGLHKTGTSLAVKLLSYDFDDPSRQNNPVEKAYGNNGFRYLTHECKIVRSINEYLIPARDSSFISPRHTDQATAEAKIAEYLVSWNKPIVLKSPYFVYTLVSWLDICVTLGKKSFVLFTTRAHDEIVSAWLNAPYTFDLHREGRLDTMLYHLRALITYCQACGIPYTALSINDLKLLNTLKLFDKNA